MQTSNRKITDLDDIERSEFLTEEEFKFLRGIVSKTTEVSAYLIRVRMEAFVPLHDNQQQFLANRGVELLNELEDKAHILVLWSQRNHLNNWMPSSISEVDEALDAAQAIAYRLEDFIKIYDYYIERPEFAGVKNQQGDLRRAVMAISGLIPILHQYKIDTFLT